MTHQVKTILETIDRLPEPEKQELVTEILRRTAHLDFPPLTDEDFAQLADNLFLELEKDEKAS